MQTWYIETVIKRYGSNGATNTDLRTYLRRDLLGHTPPKYPDKRCLVVYNSTQVVTVPPTTALRGGAVTRSRTTRAPSAALPASDDEDTPSTVTPAQTISSYSKSDFLRTLEMIQRHLYCYLRKNVSRFLDDTCKHDLIRWIADEEKDKGSDLTDANRLDVPSRVTWEDISQYIIETFCIPTLGNFPFLLHTQERRRCRLPHLVQHHRKNHQTTAQTW